MEEDFQLLGRGGDVPKPWVSKGHPMWWAWQGRRKERQPTSHSEALPGATLRPRVGAGLGP